MSSSSSDVLGPYDIGGVKRPRTEVDGDYETEFRSIIEENQSKEKKAKKEKKEKKSGKEKKGKSNSQQNDENNEINEETELTLAERLDALSKQIGDLEDDRFPDDNEVEETEEGTKQQSKKAKSSSSSSQELLIPSADSLVTLLDQALQSNDTSLLEQCLACNNIDIIETTIRKLSTQRILILLKTLVNKFERRPTRGILITHWISCILKHHLSYLITVPDLSNQLASLSQILEQRVHSFSKLTSLAGRLDLLMAQVVKQQNVQSIEPQITYEF
jgi:molecular chaperone GrpE (heat shock protein)